MISIKGGHNEAIVYAGDIEMNCAAQIRQYLDHPLFADTKVRIMPDVHFGNGAVVGFTATCNEYVVPNIIRGGYRLRRMRLRSWQRPCAF